MVDEKIMVTTIVMALIFGVYSIFQAGFKFRKSSLLIRARSDLHTKLLDRIGSGKELVEFSQTEGGQHFIDSLAIEQGGEGTISRGSPAERLLVSIQRGVILSLLGVGFLFLAWRYRSQDPGDAFSVLGVTALCLGAGFLVSSALSYRLSKKLGLISQDEAGRQRELLSHS